MKMRKSDLWLAFCAHQISWIFWSKMKHCFSLGFCAFKKINCKEMKNQLPAWEVLKKCIIIEKTFAGSIIHFQQFQQENKIFVKLRRTFARIRFLCFWCAARNPNDDITYVGLYLTKLDKSKHSSSTSHVSVWNCAAAQRQSPKKKKPKIRPRNQPENRKSFAFYPALKMRIFRYLSVSS